MLKCRKEDERLHKDVKQFLEREDNFRQLPGKAGAVKGEVKKKFVLNDYLHNLHLIFMAENPNH